MGLLKKYVENNLYLNDEKSHNMGNVLKDSLEKIKGYGGSLIENSYNIDYDEVDNIRESVRLYIKGIQDVIDKLNETVKTEKNVLSKEYYDEVMQYVGAIEKCVQAYISSFNLYSNQLYEIRNGSSME